MSITKCVDTCMEKYDTKITKKVIDLSGVKHKIENNQFQVSDGKHTIYIEIPKSIDISIDNHKLTTIAKNESARAICGTVNRNINNAVNGVKKPYSIALILVGIGYRCEKNGDKLIFSVGCSHKKEIIIPPIVNVELPKQAAISLTSIDKQAIGNFAAKLEKLRPHNVYSGKGIKIQGVTYTTKEKKKK